MVSNAIARPEPSGLVAPGGYGIEGMEGIGQADVVIPRWNIVQPTSKQDGVEGHEGQFRRNTDGAFASQLQAVILTISPTRLLWSDDLTERRPECVSRDAVTGSLPRNERGEYGACASCAFNIQANAQLAADRRAGTDVKVCGYGYTYLLADDPVENPQSMALFGVMGVSVRPAKLLNSLFVAKRRPPFSALVQFSTVLEKNDKGKYYVLKAEVQDWLKDEEVAAWREQFLMARGLAYREFEEEDAPAEPVAAAPVAPTPAPKAAAKKAADPDADVPF